MKKKIIRITESELKNYIRKVISEQSQPQTSSLDELLNKKVQLYVDRNKTTPSHIVKIVKIGTTSGGSIQFDVQDLDFVTDTGADRTGARDGKGKITSMMFNCKTSNYVGVVQDGKGGILFSPSFTDKVKQLVGCQTINRTPDFASVKSSGKDTANFA
jgi:hypothetical protein